MRDSVGGGHCGVVFVATDGGLVVVLCFAINWCAVDPGLVGVIIWFRMRLDVLFALLQIFVCARRLARSCGCWVVGWGWGRGVSDGEWRVVCLGGRGGGGVSSDATALVLVASFASAGEEMVFVMIM